MGFTPSPVLPIDANPFTDWTAHLFRADRTQYILIANTASLYSVVMYGRGITDDSVFLKSVMETIVDNLRHNGFSFIAERLIFKSTFKVYLSKSLNRAVTGSMNDLISQAKYYLEDEDVSPYDLSLKLNEMPFSYINHISPREAFSRLKIS